MSFEIDRFEPALTLDDDRHFMLSSMGLFRSLGDFRWEMVATRMALHLVTSGSGTFVEDGTPSRVGAGDLYLLQPGRHYLYHDDPGAPWRYNFVTFTGPVPVALLPGAHVTGNDTVAPIFAEIESTYRAGRMMPANAARLAWGVVAGLTPGPEPAEQDGLDARLAALVHRRDVALPTVGQIARDMGVDRSTLYRRFRASHGEPIKAWLDRQRMERAEDLLRQSETSVQRIAAICGFRDPMYFSRAFRRVHGIPPGQWREAERQAT